MSTTYVIDTSSLARLRPNNRRSSYDLSVFPGVRDALQDLITEGRLFSSLLVYKELEDYSSVGDELQKWINSNTEIFLPPTRDIQNFARMILAIFPNWIDVEKNKNDADPFVIATANSIDAIVVTEEDEIIMQPNTKNIKIPNVCRRFNLECCNILDLLRSEGFSFIIDR
jgi:hypothetical protein